LLDKLVASMISIKMKWEELRVRKFSYINFEIKSSDFYYLSPFLVFCLIFIMLEGINQQTKSKRFFLGQQTR
jgi:hypothetical protein